MKYTQAVELHSNGLLRKISYNEFEVARKFVWYLDYNKKNTYIIVPEWFITNLGTIPRLMLFFFSPTKFLAYILHDYLYSKEGVIIYHRPKEDDYHVPYTRKDADKIMREAIKVEGGLLLERNLIYWWVRIWGFLRYKKK